ncbi:hypothetical protein [Roseobacter fucihabitans]|uniref:hypothetical protein n=1 Tax=Roseobacter fucihabitans TaxID=1537242 RepID=UPI001CA378FB|nr:hypothetical protein [Roseobacter litoralis]
MNGICDLGPGVITVSLGADHARTMPKAEIRHQQRFDHSRFAWNVQSYIAAPDVKKASASLKNLPATAAAKLSEHNAINAVCQLIQRARLRRQGRASRAHCAPGEAVEPTR